MSDTYEINELGQVVPYTSGRMCNDTRAWRDATDLEMQQAQEIKELREDVEQSERVIDGLRKQVVRYRTERDVAKTEPHVLLPLKWRQRAKSCGSSASDAFKWAADELEKEQCKNYNQADECRRVLQGDKCEREQMEDIRAILLRSTP